MYSHIYISGPKTTMRFLFVLSAIVWTWLVSRCITFGPNINGICWQPHLHADTWYRLTPLPAKIPAAQFTYIPILFALLAIPALYIDNDLLHVSTVLLLVSEHAFIPIFVAHVHSERSLAIWAFLNISASILQGLLLFPLVWIVCSALQIIIHGWFLYIQLYIIFKQPVIREQEPYQERVARAV